MSSANKPSSSKGVIEPGRSISEIWNKYSLRLLYDVASTIQAENDKDDMLIDLLGLISHHVHARAATLRLLTDDGYMALVSSIGLNKAQKSKLKRTPIDGSLFARHKDPVEEVNSHRQPLLTPSKTQLSGLYPYDINFEHWVLLTLYCLTRRLNSMMKMPVY